LISGFVTGPHDTGAAWDVRVPEMYFLYLFLSSAFDYRL
jgi:hypothetical protein